MEDVQKLVHELQAHQVELEMQNEELCRAQLELESSRDAYAYLYDFAPVGYLTLDTEQVILAANLTAAGMLGVQRQDLISKALSRFILPSLRAKLHLYYREVFSTGTKQACDLRLGTTSETRLHVRLESIVVPSDGGETNRCWTVLVDVTGRKQAEDQIRELARFPRENPSPVLRVALDGTITYANKASQPLMDSWACQEAQRLPDEWCEFVADAMSSGSSACREVEYQNRVISLTAAPVVHAGYVNIYGLDITDRKRAEESLIVSNRFLEIANRHNEMASLLDGFLTALKDLTGCSAVGVRILDEEGNIPYHACDGFSPDFYESESPLSVQRDRCMCVSVIKGEVHPKLAHYTEGGSFYLNGTTRFLATLPEEEKGQTRNACNEAGYESVALVPIRMGNRILGLIHVADPRENMVPLHIVNTLEQAAILLGPALLRIRAEEALKEAHNELEKRVQERTTDLTNANRMLRILTSELSLTEERERRRLAVQLHDGLGQDLSLADMKAREALKTTRAADLGGTLREIEQLIERASREVRSVTYELSPPILYDIGFAAAVRWLAEEMQRRFGIEITLEDDDKIPSVKKEPRILLFGALRELLMNVVRHARATKVHVLIFLADGDLQIVVEDDGCGFDPAAIRSRGSGYGLFGIRERLSSLGSLVEIHAARGSGTRVTITLPMQNAAEGTP